MLKKMKSILLSLSLMFAIATPALASSAALAQAADIGNNLCSGTNFDLSGNKTDCATGASAEDFNTKLAKIINIISVVVGVVAVIMIIFGGFRYITSGGASDKVTGAKNTLLYAIIGLIIVAFAQIIVHFVISKTTTG